MKPDPDAILARALERVRPHERPPFLVRMLESVTNCLVILQGPQKTAEHLYAAADKLATKGLPNAEG